MKFVKYNFARKQMMNVRKIFTLLIGLITLPLCNMVFAATNDVYPFSSIQQQQQFNQLISQFRCLVCQNETLADSNAPLAKDLRYQVYEMVKQGKTNQQVKDYLVNRYGDFVIFKPPFNKLTVLLWMGPFLMLILALLRLYWLATRRKQPKDEKRLSAEDCLHVQKLLNTS